MWELNSEIDDMSLIIILLSKNGVMRIVMLIVIRMEVYIVGMRQCDILTLNDLEEFVLQGGIYQQMQNGIL